MDHSDRAPDPLPRRWTARVYRLGQEPGDDLSATTTAEERLAMLAELSRRMWRLTGRPVPAYSRDRIPVQIIRRA